MCSAETVVGIEGVLISRPPPLIVGGTAAVILVDDEAGVSSRCCSNGLNIPIRCSVLVGAKVMADIPSYGFSKHLIITVKHNSTMIAEREKVCVCWEFSLFKLT